MASLLEDKAIRLIGLAPTSGRLASLVMADIQPRVIVRPLDKDESGMAIDAGVSGTAHIEERSFPGLAATYPRRLWHKTPS